MTRRSRGLEVKSECGVVLTLLPFELYNFANLFVSGVLHELLLTKPMVLPGNLLKPVDKFLEAELIV